MNEQDWAERFTHEVDNLLNAAGQTTTEPTPTEYNQALDLARALAMTDFSYQSRERQVLRLWLLNQIGTKEDKRVIKEFPMRTLSLSQRPVQVLVTLIIMAFLVIALAWPNTLVASAQGIADFVQSLWVGEHTSLHQVVPAPETSTKTTQPSPPVVELRDDIWIVRTSIGNFGGDFLPDHTNTVQRFNSFEEAQAAVSFHVHQPGYLPSGYFFRETMVTPMDWVFLFYNGPEAELILVQIPVYEQVQEQSDQHSVTTAIGVGMLTDKPIEEVVLNGKPAGWVEGHSLMWEADGISYTLGGLNLTLEEAIRIAESME